MAGSRPCWVGSSTEEEPESVGRAGPGVVRGQAKRCWVMLNREREKESSTAGPEGGKERWASGGGNKEKGEGKRQKGKGSWARLAGILAQTKFEVLNPLFIS